MILTAQTVSRTKIKREFQLLKSSNKCTQKDLRILNLVNKRPKKTRITKVKALGTTKEATRKMRVRAVK